VGTRLLAEVEGQDGPGSTVLQCNSQRSWIAGNAFLEHHRFALANRELLMRLDRVPANVPLPAWLTLREASLSDDAIWLELYELGYGAFEDFVALTSRDLEIARGQPGFSLWLAEQGGVVIGKCHCWRHRAQQGLVSSVVVRPEHRGRGVAAALCARGIRGLRAGGCASVVLNVMATNAAAVSVYRRLGFEVYDEQLCYRR
jgi:mycothiol synthase